MSTTESLQILANEIALGFDALLERLDEQKKVEAVLKEQLTRGSERLNSTHSENPSDGSLSQWQDEIVKQISQGSPVRSLRNIDERPEVIRAKIAIRRLKEDMAQHTPRQEAVSREVPEARDVPVVIPRKCPVAHKPIPNYADLEKDFTTQGKPSNLECPFAQMTRNGTIDPTGQPDPIAAEFHADSLSARSLDEARACGKCPIRFMDKHSPEEIAEYFEKHKHELPRSHEICVKRYQQNESSVRQLDEKYGNIVSMIQGLGNKHKQLLRSEDQENNSGTSRKSNAAVARWANGVNASEIGDDPESEDAEDNKRATRFDKPLPDVRVGESPSRPWGISVPLNRPTAASAVSSQQDPAQSANKPKVISSPVKPAVEAVRPLSTRSRQTKSMTSASRSQRSQRTQIVFNGPVFLGYSPEQAATFLRHLGSPRAE